MQPAIGVKVHIEHDPRMRFHEIGQCPDLAVMQRGRTAGGPVRVRVLRVPLKGELPVRVQVLPGPGFLQFHKRALPAAQPAFGHQGVERALRVLRRPGQQDRRIFLPGLPPACRVLDADLTDFAVPVHILRHHAVLLGIIGLRGPAQHARRGQHHFRRIRVDARNGVHRILPKKARDFRVLTICLQPVLKDIHDGHGRGDLTGMQVPVHQKSRLVLRRAACCVRQDQQINVPAFPGPADGRQAAQLRPFFRPFRQRVMDFLHPRIMIKPHTFILSHTGPSSPAPPSGWRQSPQAGPDCTGGSSPAEASGGPEAPDTRP